MEHDSTATAEPVATLSTPGESPRHLIQLGQLGQFIVCKLNNCLEQYRSRSDLVLSLADAFPFQYQEK